MADFGGQQQHGLTSDVFSVADGTDAAVIKSADGLSAAEEITLEDRNIIAAAEGRNCTDFCSDHNDDGFIEEVGVITSFSLKTVII